MTPQEKLREAVRLINEVRPELNVKTETCPCCGLNKKENWSEAQLDERLRSVAAKIARIADQLPV